MIRHFRDASHSDRLLSRCSIVVSVLALGSVVADRLGWFDPVPYRNVKVTDLEYDETGALHVRATYVKVACKFEKMVVFGLIDGQPIDALPFEAVRGPGQEAQRTTGGQVMNLLVQVRRASPQYDEIEIRTRHICGERTVDSVFLNVDVPEVEG